MKLALCSLAAILLVGLQAGLRIPEQRAAQIVTPEPVEQEVFVDTAKLLSLHPGWPALQEMQTTLARVRATSGGVSLRRADTQLNLGNDLAPDADPQFGREQLEQEARQAAQIALSRHELDLSEALWLRMSTKREAMMESVQTDLAERSRVAEASTTALLKALEEKYCADRLKARLRVGALEVAATNPGIDCANAELSVHRARTELGEIEEACSAEKQRVRDVAQAKINALRDAEAARIDKYLAGIEAEEHVRIEKVVAQAQERIVREMDCYQDGALSVFAEGAGPRAARLPASIPTGIDVPGGRELRHLKVAVSALREQIESDVARAVKSLAGKKGMSVTFVRGDDDVPDRTRAFRDLMLKHRWTACGPVLSKTRT